MTVSAGQRGLDSKVDSVLAICRRMNASGDLDSLLDLLAHEAAELAGADRATILLLDRDRNELWSKVALRSDEILRFDARLGIAGSVLQSGETVNVSDAQVDQRFHSGIDKQTGYRTLSVLAAPLGTVNKDAIGVFQLLNKRDGSFTKGDETMLEILAGQAGIAIENVMRLGELRREKDELAKQNVQLRQQAASKFSTRNIIGNSGPIRSVVRLIDQLRTSSVSVLVTGESGTGKEMVARALHATGARSMGPFEALNCAALPQDLVESELFGIEKGVATGVDKRKGRFENGDGGTIFLDEIGDLTLTSQAKILRVLQEGVVQPVGSRDNIAVNVRVISATNKNLEQQVEIGAFREDLYFRLNVVHIQLPALRQIPEDIPLLADHFLRAISQELGRRPPSLSPEARDLIIADDWPGNIRQLRNEVERLLAVTRRPRIEPDDLSIRVREGIRSKRALQGGGQNLAEAVAELERGMIRRSLERYDSNQSATARSLGLSRQGLINKMRRYGSESRG